MHQSNGSSGLDSRSWNRIYALFGIENKNWYIGLRPWFRIPEDRKENPEDSRGDDNPNIEQFLGYGELFINFTGRKHNLSVMLRNNLRSNNRTTVQLDWAYPFSDKTKIYLQYFNGYGESLIDFDNSTNRVGLGLLFTNSIVR